MVRWFEPFLNPGKLSTRTLLRDIRKSAYRFAAVSDPRDRLPSNYIHFDKSAGDFYKVEALFAVPEETPAVS
jgi:hypothetical protein